MQDLKPNLEAPGAGLPWFQMFMARYVLGPYKAKNSDPHKNREAFEGINAKIFVLMDELPVDLHSVPVLVPRQAGLEDSSRYWSASMVVEHLLIVGEGVKKIISALAEGHEPAMKISIADIKPTGRRAALEEYRGFVATCMADLEPLIESANLSAKLEHPWFGKFNALQWHWLLATHAAVHYRQLKNIAQNLRAT